MENQGSTQNNDIRKDVSEAPVFVERVFKGDFDGDGEITAELRQIKTTKSYYPAKRIANDMQDNIFGKAEFGETHTKENMYENKETRVTWINVPENSTVESVTQKLRQFPQARLYKVLSNHPILTDSQIAAIKSPELPNATKEKFAKRQVVEYPETEETLANGTAGKVVKDKSGKVQYRAIFFSVDGKEDRDLRTEDASDFYITPEIEAKMAPAEDAHVVTGQRL